MLIVYHAVDGVSEHALVHFTKRARKAAGLRGKINVVLASGRTLRSLNRRYRNKDKATDVLSFPAVAAVSEAWAGDIVIAADIAVRNGARFGHGAEQEIKVLILHGVLHLAGYDHETDHGRMAGVEERLRRQLGLSDSLIRRARRSVAKSLHRGRKAQAHGNAEDRGRQRGRKG